MNARPEELVFENIIFNNIEEVPPPTYCEVNRGVAGQDNIPEDLIKLGGIELKRRIHKLITKIW